MGIYLWSLANISNVAIKFMILTFISVKMKAIPTRGLLTVITLYAFFGILAGIVALSLISVITKAGFSPRTS